MAGGVHVHEPLVTGDAAKAIAPNLCPFAGIREALDIAIDGGAVKLHPEQKGEIPAGCSLAQGFEKPAVTQQSGHGADGRGHPAALNVGENGGGVAQRFEPLEPALRIENVAEHGGGIKVFADGMMGREDEAVPWADDADPITEEFAPLSTGEDTSGFEFGNGVLAEAPMEIDFAHGRMAEVYGMVANEAIEFVELLAIGGKVSFVVDRESRGAESGNGATQMLLFDKEVDIARVTFLRPGVELGHHPEALEGNDGDALRLQFVAETGTVGGQQGGAAETLAVVVDEESPGLRRHLATVAIEAGEEERAHRPADGDLHDGGPGEGVAGVRRGVEEKAAEGLFRRSHGWAPPRVR